MLQFGQIIEPVGPHLKLTAKVQASSGIIEGKLQPILTSCYKPKHRCALIERSRFVNGVEKNLNRLYATKNKCKHGANASTASYLVLCRTTLATASALPVEFKNQSGRRSR